MAGRQFQRLLVDGARLRHIAVAEIVLDSASVKITLEARVCGKCFELRAEHELAVVQQRVIQRLDAQAVTRKEKHLLIAVPQGKRKHAAKMLHTGFAPLLPRVHDDLGIGTRAKGVTKALQFGNQFDKVVNLAVEHHHHAAVLIEQRLLTAGDVDDGQAPVAETHARFEVQASLVRAAMRLDVIDAR